MEEAIFDNDLEKVKEIMTRCDNIADLINNEENGDTLVMDAITFGRIKIIKCFLPFADFDIIGEEYNILDKAVQIDLPLNIIELIILFGANITERTLFCAIDSDNPKMFDFILKRAIYSEENLRREYHLLEDFIKKSRIPWQVETIKKLEIMRDHIKQYL